MYNCVLLLYDACMYHCRQATLRYRELNDGLETVQEKLRDARVSCPSQSTQSDY